MRIDSNSSANLPAASASPRKALAGYVQAGTGKNPPSLDLSLSDNSRRLHSAVRQFDQEEDSVRADKIAAAKEALANWKPLNDQSVDRIMQRLSSEI
jgi:outer membrane murein-binding lipoprotein Lpp